MLDALTLDQIRTFVAVADRGSFRAGAGSLSRAQSGVSVSIANLEAQLGVLLFDRSGHRPVLTSEGKALLADARDVLLRVDAMRARARGFGEGVELALPIVVDTLFPLETVGAALTQMRACFPSVAIRVSVEPLGGPVTALKDRRCTLAIMVGEDFRDPRISFDALSSLSQVAVVAGGHPLAGLCNIGLPDLADHVQIVQSDPSALSEGRDFGVLSPQSCRVNSQSAKHALILSGLGWGRLPLWLIKDDLSAGRLVRLKTTLLGQDSEVQSQCYLARRLDEPFGPAATSFAAALMRICRPDGGGYAS
ncbi:LysR family transcriptional regulator [Paracoccus caeni]|uniref:LysR family transcriptional regulator n=1 Tax=Paracoccus caeni TaxID=657651 RepID=A0A934SNR5_9RHOB|nr:LysR family transcriptional regulator [Paracoccus caeni]MBK4217678.1 LysR family transcriptional regulator [Paracoccus caeni]